MSENLNKFQRLINIKFNNVDLLKSGLIHKSFSQDKNNEKLEFLGDRVLGLVLAKTLLEIYPDEKEGIIDKKYANLVNRKTCALIAQKMNLKKYLTLGDSYNSLKRSDEKILSDGLEALIGAIFLDKGLMVSEKFILKYWADFLKKSIITEIDSKTKLQEFSLKKFKILPVYKFFKQSGPEHNPVFKVEVKITNSKKYKGLGNSKKKAQQDAAKNLLIDFKI